MHGWREFGHNKLAPAAVPSLQPRYDAAIDEHKLRAQGRGRPGIKPHAVVTWHRLMCPRGTLSMPPPPTRTACALGVAAGQECMVGVTRHVRWRARTSVLVTKPAEWGSALSRAAGTATACRCKVRNQRRAAELLGGCCCNIGKLRWHAWQHATVSRLPISRLPATTTLLGCDMWLHQLNEPDTFAKWIEIGAAGYSTGRRGRSGRPAARAPAA